MFPKKINQLRHELLKIDFYKIFTYFFLCALIGWIFETIVVFLASSQLTDRGLLFVGKDFSIYFN